MAVVMVRGHSIDVDQVAQLEEFYCAAGGGYATIAFSGGTVKTIRWGGKENELAKTEFDALVENMEA